MSEAEQLYQAGKLVIAIWAIIAIAITLIVMARP